MFNGYTWFTNIFYNSFLTYYIVFILIAIVLILLINLLYAKNEKFANILDNWELRLEKNNPYQYLIYSKIKVYLFTEIGLNYYLIVDFISIGWIAWVVFYPILCLTVIILLLQTLNTVLFALNYIRILIVAIFFKKRISLFVKDNTVNISSIIYRTAFYSLFIIIPRARAFLCIYYTLKFITKTIAKLQYKFNLGLPIASIDDVQFGPYTETQQLKKLEDTIEYSFMRWMAITLVIVYLTIKIPLVVLTGYGYYSLVTTLRFIRRADTQSWVYRKGGFYPYINNVILHGIIFSVPLNLSIEYLKINLEYVNINEFGQHIEFVDQTNYSNRISKLETSSINNNEKDYTMYNLEDSFNTLFENNLDLLDKVKQKQMLQEYEESVLYDKARKEFHLQYPLKFRILFNPHLNMRNMHNQLSIFNDNRIIQKKIIDHSTDRLFIVWSYGSKEDPANRHLGVGYKLGLDLQTNKMTYLVTTCSSKESLQFEFKDFDFKQDRNILLLDKAYNPKVKLQFTTNSFLATEEHLDYNVINNLYTDNAEQKLDFLATCYKRMVYDTTLNIKFGNNHLGYSDTSNKKHLILKPGSLEEKVNSFNKLPNAFNSDRVKIKNFITKYGDLLSNEDNQRSFKLTALSKLTVNGAKLIGFDKYNKPNILITYKDIVNFQKNDMSKNDILLIDNIYNSLYNNI